MSIIYEALKKIQKSEQDTQNTAAADKAKKSKYKVYLFYFLVICVGVFIGSIFFRFLGRGKAPSQKKSALPVIQEKIPAPVIEPADKPKQGKPSEVSEAETKPLGSLVVNGVFFSQDVEYALINNRIVKEGDEIDGAKVKSVTLYEVVLDYDGQEVRLPSGK